MGLTRDQAIALLDKEWPDDNSGDYKKICAEIIDYVWRVPVKQLKYLTYGTFQNVTDHKYDKSDVAAAILHISGHDDSDVLRFQFEFLDQVSGQVYPVSREEHLEAVVNDTIIHPETGEEVELHLTGPDVNLIHHFDASHRGGIGGSEFEQAVDVKQGIKTFLSTVEDAINLTQHPRLPAPTPASPQEQQT